MYTYESYCSDTITAEEFTRLENFVAEARISDEPAAPNMNWAEPAGLLYNIKHQLRWRSDQGCIYLVLADNQPVAVSCVEYPEHATTWAVAGVRSWITPAHRSTHVASFFLNIHLKWAAERKCNFVMLTFNDYNRAAWSAVANGSKYRRAAGWSSWWDDCYAMPNQIMVRSTMQWCVIKPVACQDNTNNAAELISWSAAK